MYPVSDGVVLAVMVAVLGGNVLVGISVGVAGMPGGKMVDNRDRPNMTNSAMHASATSEAQPRLPPRFDRLPEPRPGWFAVIWCCPRLCLTHGSISAQPAIHSD